MRAITLTNEAFATMRTCLDMVEKDVKEELRSLEGRLFFKMVDEQEACRRVLARIEAARRELRG